MFSDTTLITIIATIPPTIMALAAFVQAYKTHSAVNSRMTELLELTKKASHAEGKEDEKSDEAARVVVRKKRTTK